MAMNPMLSLNNLFPEVVVRLSFRRSGQKRKALGQLKEKFDGR